MGTKYLRYQNQEAIHFDQVLKGEAVTLSNKDGIKFVKKKIVLKTISTEFLQDLVEIREIQISN